jgi:hypothetical protein
LECLTLANEFDQFGDAAASAKDHKFFLLQQEFFNGAALLLVE